jgi:hypothetical protein
LRRSLPRRIRFAPDHCRGWILRWRQSAGRRPQARRTRPRARPRCHQLLPGGPPSLQP